MRRCLILLKLDIPNFVDTHGRAALFLTEMEEESTGGWGQEVVEEGQGGGEGGKTAGQNVK